MWLKFENLQFTASFKERGALNKLLSLSEQEKQHGVIAASAVIMRKGSLIMHSAQESRQLLLCQNRRPM